MKVPHFAKALVILSAMSSFTALHARADAMIEVTPDPQQATQPAFEASVGYNVPLAPGSVGDNQRPLKAGLIVEADFKGFQEDGAPREKRVLFEVRAKVKLDTLSNGVSVPAYEFTVTPFQMKYDDEEAQESPDGIGFEHRFMFGETTLSRDIDLNTNEKVTLNVIGVEGGTSLDVTQFFVEGSLQAIGATFMNVVGKDGIDHMTSGVHLGDASLLWGLNISPSRGGPVSFKIDLIGVRGGGDVVGSISTPGNTVLVGNVDGWVGLDAEIKIKQMRFKAFAHFGIKDQQLPDDHKTDAFSSYLEAGVSGEF